MSTALFAEVHSKVTALAACTRAARDRGAARFAVLDALLLPLAAVLAHRITHRG